MDSEIRVSVSNDNVAKTIKSTLMRINKYLYPVILLIIFFGVIALGVAAGYWETKGGRGRYQHESALPAPAVVQLLEIPARSDSTWLL